MNRRAFLGTLGAAAIARHTRLSADDRPWQTFEITTRVHILQPAGVTRVWLPTPLAAAPYQTTLGDTYTSDDASLSMVERDEIDMLAAQWPDGSDPRMRLVSRVQTRSHAVNIETPTVPPPQDFAALNRYLVGTTTMPLDAAAKSQAATMTRAAGTDFERARAIFDAVASRTDSADRNLRIVALCRASGVPARPVFGLRLAGDDATRAQHCRAEVYLVGFGWVPIDARDGTFGSWAANWMAYNTAQDLALPGSLRSKIGALTHPQGETDNGRLDSLAPDAFNYSISVSRN